jgi:hypothetical protein
MTTMMIDQRMAKLGGRLETNSVMDNGLIKSVLLTVNTNEPHRFYRLRKP